MCVGGGSGVTHVYILLLVLCVRIRLGSSSIKRRWSHCIYVLGMQMSANEVMNGCENLKNNYVFADILVCPQL